MNTDMSITSLILQASLVVQLVMAGLVLVSYAEDGPIDRGRVWSVGYTVTLRDVTSYGE